MNKYKFLVAGLVLAIASLGGINAAQASSQVAVNLPNEAVAGGTTVQVPVTVDGFVDSELNVRAVAGSGTFTLANPGSLVLNRGYSSFADQSVLSFHGANADVVDALRNNLSWTAPGDASTSAKLELRLEVTKFIFGTTYDPLTGHTYMESSGEASWHDAVTAAQNISYEGQTGYLATITSQTENDAIEGISGTNEILWLGGTDKEEYVNEALVAAGGTQITSDSQLTGDFYWASGPEAGTQFSTGLSTPQPVDGSYLKWVGSEPNNLIEAGNLQGEACQVMIISPNPGEWNDTTCDRARLYLIEFDTGLEIFGTSVATFDNINGDSKDIDLTGYVTTDLANTGFDAWVIALLALALVGVGTGLRVFAKRK
jgi:hypothetical protein